jgi:DNA-binding transcriptional LysR family regulator
MDINQLKCLLAVIEEGGFNRATTRLHITQPALSYQIKQLEKELEVKLFERRPGGVSPTEAGRVLAQHARTILEAVREATRAVEAISGGAGGEVRIGTINSVGIYFLPQVLWRIKQKQPQTNISVTYQHSSEVIETLLENKIDLALVANPSFDRRLQAETILEEQVSLVCSRSHPLFGKKQVRPVDLKGLQFVALSPASPTGKLVKDFMARLGISIEPVVSSDNVETVKRMVEVGMGIAFLPDMVIAEELCGPERPDGKLYRLSLGQSLARRIALVYWKHSQLNRSAKLLIEEIKFQAATCCTGRRKLN